MFYLGKIRKKIITMRVYSALRMYEEQLIFNGSQVAKETNLSMAL
jgi:hypothetical protein